MQSPAPIFTRGPIMRHVAVMTATGSLGLVAVFIVDLLNLFYISLLGEAELAAAIGYAGTIMFFTTSVALGIMIAASATVSRALGAGRPRHARRLATASVLYMTVATVLLTLLLLPLIGPVLHLLGARGQAAEIGHRFLSFVTLSTPLLGLGMVTSSLLRATGDASRAMWVTLGGGLVTAVLDPLLILGLGLGVDGAAIASILSRCAMAAMGLYWCSKTHNLFVRPRLALLLNHAQALGSIAIPAILTNIATPVGNAFVTSALSPYGDQAVAAWAVIGRTIPVAFGPLFALTGAVGPIFGQNIGAGLFDRLRTTLRDSLILTVVYVGAVWVLLALGRHQIAAAFSLAPDAQEIVAFFCLISAGSFIFLGAMFVSNAAFNNLGAPLLSTGFNWGRATLGTMPFVWIGGHLMGANGVILGQSLGAAVFGVPAMVFAFRLIDKIRRTAEAGKPMPESHPAPAELPPLASPQDAVAIDR
ncbi:MATE family efflux transporter [Azorhizobium oxalatiphilum]|uniref:MATE family efflux transporter n=1 Tax=Azorhizobium oxalatiphilum TaxID=980631 RepID=A0A917FE93_9HYPH|nr:MATE family efflux transporter [Azorhizobium oxalatiphilum]GGF69453.1 MATE family efflux transporter [Azorhizobium oxalatiphilum]